MSIDYRITPKKECTPQIGVLISMLEHSRAVTLSEIEDLTIHELDQQPSPFQNSIGALLQHIAGIEKVHQLITFEGRDFSDREWNEWKPSILLGEEGKQLKGQPLDYYINYLSSVRIETIRELRDKTDEWLWKEYQWPNQVTYNYHYMWYHVMEDELNHRGQIRLLKKNFYSNATS